MSLVSLLKFYTVDTLKEVGSQIIRLFVDIDDTRNSIQLLKSQLPSQIERVLLDIVVEISMLDRITQMEQVLLDIVGPPVVREFSKAFSHSHGCMG